MMFALRTILFAMIVFYLASCGRESYSHSYSGSDTGNDPTTDSDTDSDLDSDTDADSETGTDSDSETDTSPPPGCEGAISFPDPGLNRVVRIAIGIHSGDIYYEDLQGVTSLYISDSG